MYYVYLLKDSNQKLYIGYSSNLIQRIKSHSKGTTITTAKMENPKLLYYEAYSTESEARTRESKLKLYGSSYAGLLKRLGLK